METKSSTRNREHLGKIITLTIVSTNRTSQKITCYIYVQPILIDISINRFYYLRHRRGTSATAAMLSMHNEALKYVPYRNLNIFIYGTIVMDIF